VEDGDVVTAFEQLAHDERPGELGPAENENAHRAQPRAALSFSSMVSSVMRSPPMIAWSSQA